MDKTPLLELRWRPVLAVLLMGVAVVVGGCMPFHPEQPVAAPVAVPESFSAQGCVSFDNRWWQSFEQPELNALVEQALNKNLDLKQALARIEQSRALARKAGARLLPSVGVSGTRTRTRQKAVSSTLGGDAVIADALQWAAEFTASYELDLWGKNRAGRMAAVHTWQAQREAYDAAMISLSAQVTTTWFQLLEQRAQAALQQEQLETSRKYLELVELQFGQGQATAVDVYGQRQQVTGTEARAPLIRARVETLQHQLALLLGVPPRAPVAFPGNVLPTLPALPQTGVPAELVGRRPDVRAARWQVATADRNVAVALADRFPSISLSARFSDQAQHVRQVFDMWLLSLAANVAQPLFDGGLRRAETARTRAVLDEKTYAYGQTVLSAFSEVEDALTREREQMRYFALLNKQTGFARSTLTAARKRYRDGVGDYFRVLTALQSVQALERTLLEARLALLQYRVALCKALGGSWREDASPLADISVSVTTGEDTP